MTKKNYLWVRPVRLRLKKYTPGILTYLYM